MGVDELTFWVPGAPVTQGSKRVFGGRLVEVTGARLEVWRTAVGYEALGARPRGWQMLTGPVEIAIEFRLHRPQRPKFEVPAAKGRNDLDKLLRAVGDALTNVAYEDDGQITDARVRKRYAVDGRVGAQITVRRLDVSADL